MGRVLTKNNSGKTQSLRFGGISPIVLRELSGVYQPFVKAVKELISNSYDADANRVKLIFNNDYKHLDIFDDGSGMNPIEFIKDYIRIGKSYNQDAKTKKKKRPRIGGKGIGFLSPARYCDKLIVRSKKSEVSLDKLFIELNNEVEVDISSFIIKDFGDSDLLKYITVKKVTNELGDKLDVNIDDFIVKFNEEVKNCLIWYEFDSRHLELYAEIDFNMLFSLESSKSLENIGNFCDISISENKDRKNESYTEITLQNIKEFVREDLLKEAKIRAKNIESFSGLEQFLWSLSRIIPVQANLHSFLPSELCAFVNKEIDGVDSDYSINVECSYNETMDVQLKRSIIKPEREMNIKDDSDIIKYITLDEEDGFKARGFLIGQSSTIYPAETRGILLRVKGVAVGEPTYFGLDQQLTGAAKVALSQISGEINIISGIDALEDINPGRDGFYKESKKYNLLREHLIGNEPDRLIGDLKNVIDAIIVRSEVNASINNFLKKHEAQRKAIIDMSASISELIAEQPEIMDSFINQQDNYELFTKSKVNFKAEGKLSSFTVKEEDNLNEDYTINYVDKELIINKNADFWKKNIDIMGQKFDLQYKKGKDSNLFCEINPSSLKIYINWEHPMKAVMGDNSYIKHCIASIISSIPQEQLNTYVRLITNKLK